MTYNSCNTFLPLREVRRVLLLLLMLVMGVGSAWGQSSGSGTADDPYIIANSTDLNTFGSKMNNNTQYWKLGADIDYGGAEWAYSGNSQKTFKGHFDGDGHTISNYTITPITNKANALFAIVQGTSATDRAEIKNLTIDNVTISTTGDLANTTYIGALAGNVASYVDFDGVNVNNVTISVKNLPQANYIGAFAGLIQKNSTIKNCSVNSPSVTVSGEIKTGASFIGGAIGQFAGTANEGVSKINGLTVTSPYVSIDKVSIKECFIGAVFGRINTYSDVKSVTVSNPVLTYDYTDNPNVSINIGSFAGGIVGVSTQETAITDITVNDKAQLTIGTTANIETTNISQVKAGLVGQLSTYVSIEKWTVKGSEILINGNLLTSASYLGGLAGYITTGCKIKGECSVENPKIEIKGNVGVGSYIGGAIGDFVGTNGNTSSIKGLTVKSPSITVNNYSAGTSLTGGVFGRVSTFTAVDGVNLTDASMSFTEDILVAQQIGTFAGTITGNATQQISVKNVTIDNSNLTFGSSNTSNTTAIKAGVIGQVSSNVLLDTWKVTGNSSITVNGNLNSSVFTTKETAADSRLGGFIGNTVTAASAPVTINNIEIGGNSTINVTGKVDIKAAYLGGVLGYSELANAANNQMSMDKIEVKGTTSITVTGGINTGSYLGGFAGYILGRAATSCSIKIDNITLASSSITVGGEVKAGSYFGGLAGMATTGCAFDKWKITADSKLTLSDDVTGGSYIAGAIGNLVGNATYPTTATNFTVGNSIITTGTSDSNKVVGSKIGLIGQVSTGVTVNTWNVTNNTITINGNLATTGSQIGGFIGNAASAAGAPLKITNNNITGNATITVTGSITDKASQVGGFVGYVQPADAANNKVTISTAGIGGTSSVSIGGNVAVGSHLGGFAGYITGRSKDDCATTVEHVTVKTANVSVTGNTTAGSYYGGLAGYVAQGCTIDDWNITTATISVDGDVTAASFIGGAVGSITAAAGYPSTANNFTLNNATVTLGTNTSNQIIGSKIGLVGQASTNVSLDTWTVTGNNSININSYFTSTASHVGGFIGYMESKASAPTTASNINLGENNSIVANGNITGTVYIGGAFGNLTGVADKPQIVSSFNLSKPTITINGNNSSTLDLGGLVGYMTIATLKESSVTGADIILNGNNTNSMYVGGAVGWMAKTVAPFATVEKVTVKDSKIRTSGTPTYAKGNKPLVVGGLVGYMDQNATNFCDVHNCVVDNIDINLGGYIPEAVNTSGNLYNQQQNAMVVGGVIGRINTPSRLPEYLYFSGKINAPFAMVAPVVGVFLTSISSANYAFDDYTGANAPNVINQWQKALTWYYTDYNLGLSSAVRTQTARTKNYTAGTTNIGGVEYLNIQQNTLLEYNGMGNISKTVLRYDVSGVNRDFGLFPAWNTTSATYPEYYMYYMQGVNRGKYVESGMAEAAKSIVLNGLLYTLEFSQSAERSFKKTFTVSSTEPMDSYEWYINGEKQSETSNQYTTVMTIEQVTDPNTSIYVYGVKDEKKVAMTTGVPSRVLLRVRDESKAITTYGTKDNPYLIGGTYGAQELQLLSFLSTLDTNIKWEGNFISSTHYNRAYYELESDIDMSGVADFTPISLPKRNNTDGTSSGYHQNFVFDGVFDGKGHTISGLKIGWYAGALNTNDQNMGWGLFAAVGNPTAQKKVGEATTSNAVIQNLIIDGATLTHRTDNTSFYYNNGVSGNANYCMVGVLAGIVSNNVTIQDIEIRNSKITDEGSRNYSLATKGLYVGGAIGSYQTGFNATNYAQVNSRIQHIAAQVDITLTRPQIADVSAVAQLSQFNVGGIIGRYIATSASKDQAEAAMPKYTIYSGTVKTPRAWVSPVLGSLRYKDQNGLTVWTNYSKQYEGNNNTDATQIAITNALYYNFYIDTDKITDAFPTNTCKRGSRTLSEHVDIVESAIMYNAMKYQGVNYEAKYIDMEGASLEYLNENRTGDYNWLWEDGFVHLSTDPYIEARISRDENTFTASLMGATAVGYTWKLSFDGETWYDIPDETKATYTAQESPKQKFIRAFVSDGTKDYPTLSMVVEAVEICTPAISYTEDSEYRTYTADLNVVDGIDISHLDIEYQWYDWNKELIPGATNPTYAITMDEVNQHHEVVWCVVTIKEIGFTMTEYTLMAGGTVVYVDGTNGIDNVDGSTERGWTDSTPVKTIDHANSLLKSKDEGGTMDNNIIVIMGVLNPQAAGVNHTNLDKDKYTNRFQSHGKNPATLTGKYGSTDYNGEIILCEYGSGGAESNVNDYERDGHNCYVLADTKFEYLTFSGSSAGNNFIECHGNDVTFGKGLKMEKFKNLTKTHGNFNGSQIIPELTIVLTATNPSEVTIETYTNREKPQVVTFQSGHYGRIMGGRYTQGFFSLPGNTSHTILGSAKHPIWAEVNIDIDNDNQKSGYVQKNADNLPASSGTYDYTCDINALVAGLTDGTMYGDYTINFHGGTISYIVGGNQGNPVPNGTAEYKNIGVDGDEFFKAWGQWPNASYFGRSVINIDQREGLKNVTVDNIYAGGLGRQANGDKATSIVDMYVYGQTEVNIMGGTVNSCIYAGGAGGVLGQNPWDAHAPYATTDPDNAAAGIINGVQYGDTRAGTWSTKTADAALATVILHNRLDDGTYEEFPLNLANSSATINISGGAVNGDVYGGGFGQVEDMPAAVTMQGVGSVFGTTNINISGGTITGSVYGGSRGSSVYYHEVNKYGQTIDHIAEMNGTINLTISGTKDKYPYIKSAIYGAGRGLSTAQRKATQADVDAGKADNVGDTYTEEYPRIATAGNTDLGDGYRTNVNITIDFPESVPFPNDIYGGGQMGLVDGDINIILKRGTLTGNIYGGGYGEREHLGKAKVTGYTKVSTGAEDVAEVDVNAPVTISGGVNIYGGGDMAQVKGDTFINLNHGKITANVFGGGRGLTQSDSGTFTDYGKVTGNTRVWINNQTPDNILTGNIYGGGALGAVQGNTTVVVKAGEVEGNVFGGGKGEEGSEKAKVTGNTNVIVDSGWTEPTPDPVP